MKPMHNVEFDATSVAEVVSFVPRADLDAQDNLRAFVSMCRNKLTTMGAELPFDKDTWDVTEVTNRRAHNCRETLSFTVQPVKHRDWNARPMAEPFKSFAKAYIRYQHGLRPIKSLAQRLAALRALECAAADGNNATVDPTSCTRHTFNRASQLLAERCGRSAAYSRGQQLEVLANFLDAHRLVAVPLRWKNNIKRPAMAGRIGSEFDEARRQKLPSPAALNAIAQIFRMAESPSDIIVASVCAILSAAPSRINEVCHLEAQCEVSETIPSSGQVVFGLRWKPSKGGEAMVKWCSPSMATVVQEAVAKIRSVTEISRGIAKWYEANPNSVYLPPEIEYLRNKERITYPEVCDVVFLEPPEDGKTNQAGGGWCRHHGVAGLRERGATEHGGGHMTVSFADVERVLLGMLPSGFPVANRDTGLKFSESLLLVRKSELGSQRGTYRGVIQLVDVAAIRARLAGDTWRQNIFQRFGFTEDDGSAIRITTHQFRHYLNTIAQSGGLGELDIAKWSGRVNVSQNAVYNHQSDRDILALVREAVGDETRMFGPLASIPTKALIPRDEFARLKVQTAHTTEFGYCIHDFTMLPCQIHRDCINCDEQVCIKGDTAKEGAIRHCRDTTRELLEEALEGVRDGAAGANRWVQHQTKTIERLDQLCAILDDPRVPNGAVIQPAGVVPASKLDLAAERRRLSFGIEATRIANLSSDRPSLPMPTDLRYSP